MQKFSGNCGWLYLILLRLSEPLARLVFWVRYRDVGNIPKKGGFVVCCNHRSLFDPYLLTVPFRRQIRYMAKSELFTDHGFAARWFLRALGAFPVRRDTGDRKSLHAAVEILRRGGIVGIFPQGRIVWDDSPVRPKPGAALVAALAGVPVLPAAIRCRGPVVPFHPMEIRFGAPLTRRALFPRGTSSACIRRASEVIADHINRLLEAKP